MSKYLDFKITTWKRLYFKDDQDLDKTISDLYKGFTPYEIESEECEDLCDTEEFIGVNENDGCSTIEIYDNNKLIWDNSYTSEINRKLKNDNNTN
jgi:hypothetical protein